MYSTDGKSASRNKKTGKLRASNRENATHIIARSALSIRAAHLILMFVRACVREIIDFYEGEQKAASLLLSTGSLSS